MSTITHNLLWMIYGAAAVVCVYVLVALAIEEPNHIILSVSLGIWVTLIILGIVAHQLDHRQK